MNDAPNDKSNKILYQIFIEICVAFRNNTVLFWTVLIWGILQCLISALLPITLPWTPDNPHIKGTLIAWILQNASTILAYGFCLILLTALASVTSRLKEGFTKEELKRLYLRHMITKKEYFRMRGLPAHLTVQEILLDDVFIPLQFKLNEPLADYPLTETELSYYEEYKKQKGLSEEEGRIIDRLLYKNKQSWLDPLRQNTITLADLWNRLAKRQHVIIIQGFPGTGKSTLLDFLALYMARQNLHFLYRHKFIPKLKPKLIPIYIELGNYVKAYNEERGNNPDNQLSLRNYLIHILQEFPVTGIDRFIIDEHLRMGHCLVLLDGLEEVVSEDIQQAIVTFIRDYSVSYESNRNFNRFLITSRIAPHSKTPFPIIDEITGYQTVSIAELITKQIEDFLLRWSLASKNDNDTVTRHNWLLRIKKIINERTSQLTEVRYPSIKDQMKLGDLIERPLLLALLAVMQSKQMLPKHRVELYSTITHILLETHKTPQHQSITSEAEIVQVLGALAFSMQEKGSRIIHRSELMKSLISEGQAEDFLDRLRFQSGLFVQRAGDYFGFFHPALQVYIASRYIFNKVKQGTGAEVDELVISIYQNDNLIEPLYLAASYKSNEDSTVAKRIIQSLLAEHQSQQSGVKISNRQILLAARCLLESEGLISDPNLNDPSIDESIAKHLLQCYEETYGQQLTASPHQIEEIITLWFKKLPIEVHRTHPLLTVFYQVIRDSNKPVHQKVALALFTAIEEHLLCCSCTSTILNEFIPLFLTLAGLPSIGKYRTVSITTPINSEVAKLAQAILLHLSQYESTELSLGEMNQYFASQSNTPSASNDLLSKEPGPTI